MTKIIGRIKEKQILTDLYASKKAEFIAVYGRRRVGKTFLIREFFKKKSNYFFEFTGQRNASIKSQLDNFYDVICTNFSLVVPIKKPVTWNEAFKTFTLLIEQQFFKKKVIIFLDELPWLASKRSGLIEALDYFWNRKWSQMKSIKLIVCGSAAAWMIEKLINAKGGLYNRLTSIIRLKPFSIFEIKKYIEHKNIKLPNSQLVELYMAIGGVPYYFDHVKKGQSATQIINDLYFS